jgi:site-specific DNA recombinase
METALIYCRVSDPRQVDEGNSLATQERQAKEYAQRNGYALARVFIERGESAKTDERPVLKEMLAYCKAGRDRAQVVVVPKIDRLARNAYDYANLKLQLRRYGLRLESVGERIEDTPVGRFTENVLASAAQFDNEVRAERCRGGMVEAVQEGRWVWLAPRGYRNIRIHGKGTIEPHPSESTIVRRAFEKLASGRHGSKEVCGWLTDQGIKMTVSRLHEMVRNKVYIGQIVAFGQTHPAVPPFVPLVTPETFYRAQASIRRPTVPTHRYGRDHPDFPLRGTLRCGCGRIMTGAWSTGRSRRYGYYNCASCPRMYLERTKVESDFSRELARFSPQLLALGQVEDALKRQWELRQADVEKRQEQAKKTIISLRELREAIIMKNAKGVVPDDLAQEQIESITRQIVEEENSSEPMSDRESDVEKLVAFAAQFLLGMGNFWSDASLQNKKRLQQFLYPNGLTYVRDEGFRTDDYPVLEEIKGFLRVGKSDLVDHPDAISNHSIAFLLNLWSQFGEPSLSNSLLS